MSIIIVIISQLFAFWNKYKLSWSIYTLLSLTIQAVSANPDAKFLKQQTRWHYFATGNKMPVQQQSGQPFGWEEYYHRNSQVCLSVLGLILSPPSLTGSMGIHY